ncbi:DUF2806 domain-containing protein [Pseudomonas antarctica]|uniref:DUF2806 domain-containing protein n=1 Tax=Pseudomonas antarctica TaxID=219572 RepID=UPI0039C04C18
MGEGFSLVDLKGVSKPITKLIQAVSKGIGAIYEPVSTVRNAKAEAKARLILAESDAALSEIKSRALERVNYREVRRQKNIDSIVKGAVCFLPDEVSTEEVDEDWIVDFFELAQDIGNADMQKIWSKLLAGETAKPGSFKPRTLGAVKLLTPQDAHMFTNMCSFSFLIDDDGGVERVMPIFSYEYFQFVRSNGFSVTAESHMMSIGLLSSVNLWYRSEGEEADKINLYYFSENYYTSPEVEEESNGEVALQAFPFTEVGAELYRISGAQPNKNFINLLLSNSDLYAC